ncbi:MAG: hypothetical protein GY799_16285 [Desulfobulbaceae bacterium]|nr:hypothetical protein [Desulfobulbaceae bacterium]
MTAGTARLQVSFTLPPVIGFAAGFFTKWFLQSKKSRDELLRELTPQRAQSLKALWKLTTPFAIDPKNQAEQEIRVKADSAFRKWYFDHAGAMFLSWKSTKIYFEAIDCLRDENSSPQTLENRFSRLRTKLKQDFGIYTRWNSLRKLPTPRAPITSAKKANLVDAKKRAAD